MRFKREESVRDFIMLPEDEPVSFTTPEARRIVVTLSPSSEEGPSTRRTTLVVAEVEIEPDQDIVDAFVSLEANRLPKGSVPREQWPSIIDFITENGEIRDNYMVPMSILPEKLQNLMSEISTELSTAIRDVFSLVRWRLGHGGPHRPYGVRGDFWTLDGEQWHGLPMRGVLAVLDSRVPRLDDQARSAIQELLDRGDREPLAHILWREAWEQRHTNPRSAILVGVSALEVGVKQFVSLHLPGAGWLLEEMPTPPVNRMLTDFLPTLPEIDGESFARPDDQLLQHLKRAVTLRNKVAHTGYSGFDTQELERALAAVKDVLWKLDQATGQSWAEEHDAYAQLSDWIDQV